ncbi:MAG: tetratricopeptide repeat protein, partial [Candidatus Obscuribacterales bacterium]|nr:tetratricopeptide repeat protein [Candidatus Obscuribacterales bacterium]
ATADSIISRSKAASETLAIIALCKFYTGKSAEAEQDFKNAQGINPASSFVMLVDGILKMNRGEFEEAAEQLRFAGEADSRGSPADRVPQSLAHLALSKLYRKQGLFSEAIQEAHAASKDKRFEAKALALECRALLADKSSSDAPAQVLKLIQQAESLNASDPDLLLSRAFYELEAGKLEEARKLSNSSMTILPAEADEYLLLSKIYGQESKVAEQKAELEKGLKLAEKDPELLFELGRLYLNDNNAAQAVNLLRQALERRVKAPELCFLLAEACEKTGDSKESLKYYKESLSQGLCGETSTKAKAAISRLELSK